MIHERQGNMYYVSDVIRGIGKGLTPFDLEGNLNELRIYRVHLSVHHP